MEADAVLNALFPDGHAVTHDQALLHGTAEVNGTTLAVLGTAEAAPIGVEIALQIARGVLGVVREAPGRPILLLVDTSGQRLSRRDELLGINSYLAHLAKCVELARRRGHRILSLVYEQAVSGGYLATGMQADACFALPDAEIKVMGLPAMARVTKIRLEALQELSRSSPVFAPGVDNYLRMGALDALWAGDLAAHLVTALRGPAAGDRRRESGEERGGRQLACAVAQRVREDAID